MSAYPLTAVNGSTLTGLLTPQGGHVLAFATCFGVNVWQTISGGIAFKAIPRLQFRSLQTAIFPPYFILNTTASAYLLISQYLYHPSPTSLLHPFSSGQSLQLATVGLHLACHAINATVIGPKTTVVMKKRARLEREEGKAYNAEGVSDEMKALNKSFGIMHGVSSLLNLGALLLIASHGLWIAKYGV